MQPRNLQVSAYHLPVWEISDNQLHTAEKSEVVWQTTYHTTQAPTIKIFRRTITPPPSLKSLKNAKNRSKLHNLAYFF